MAQDYVIVGLPYYNKGKVQSFLTELEKSRPEITLCHDASCAFDNHSIAAIVDGAIVGHIKTCQAQDFWMKLEATAAAAETNIEDTYIYAELVSVDRRDGVSEKCAFTVRPNFGCLDALPPEKENPWEDWGEGLLPMPKSQHDVVYNISLQKVKGILSAKAPLDEEKIIKQLEDFRRMYTHELDAESRQLVINLTDWLLSQESENLQQLGREFERLPSSLNEYEHLEERVNLWWPAKLASPEGKAHWKHYLKLNGLLDLPSKDKMLEMLKDMAMHLLQLPEQLSEHLDEGRHFFSALFYSSPPREKLSRLYGCLVICHYLQHYLGPDCCHLLLADCECQPAETMPVAHGSKIRIAKKRLTSILIVFDRMYKANWFVGAHGEELHNRDKTVNDILWNSFGVTCDHIPQMLNPSGNYNPDKQKELLEDLLNT